MNEHFERLGVEHPARHRERLSAWRQTTPLVAPFLIWGNGLVAKFFFAEAACTPVAEAGLILAPGAVRWWIAGIDVVVLLALLAVTVLAFMNWRRVRGEHSMKHHIMMDIGEGRTEILAHWGLLMSAGFVVVAIFDTVPVFLAPVC